MGRPPPSPAYPPPPLLSFRVGVTGHRAEALAGAGARGPELAARIGQVLAAVAREVEAAGKTGAYAAGEPKLVLISALAGGTDQTAAQAALDAGWSLQAILPYLSAELLAHDFRDDPDAARRFRDLCGAAERVLELDGRPQTPEAYQAGGYAILRHADLLLAVWDAEPPRGAGGTADLVRAARERSVPTVWISPRPPHPVGLIPPGSSWPPEALAADPPAVLGLEHLESVIRHMLQPPLPEARGASGHRGKGKAPDLLPVYFAETDRSRRPRRRPGLCYDLAIGLCGGGWNRGAGRGERGVGSGESAGWLASARSRFRGRLLEPADLPAELRERLETVLGDAGILDHYAWTDGLAAYYAGKYRGAFTLGYVLAPLATFFAVFGVIVGWDSTAARAVAAVGEAACLAGIFGLYWRGTKQHWHLRWIDYRSLAERLRYLIFLLPLGRPTSPLPVPAHQASADPTDTWASWLHRALVRNAGVFPGRLDAGGVAAWRNLLAQSELAGQLDYHRRTGERMRRVAQRLHRRAAIVFVLAAASLALEVAWHWVPGALPHPVAEGLELMIPEAWISAVLGMLAVGLPAVGAAMHGFLSQGDFQGIARRSDGVGAALARLRDALAREVEAGLIPGAEALGARAEEAARAMGAEMMEWRVEFLARPQQLV